MKGYRISKPVFWAIFVLILTLPVSREWRLMSTGEKIRVTAGAYEHHAEYDRLGNHYLFGANSIEFMAGSTAMHIYGPHNHDLGVGRELTLWYKAGDPSQYCLFNFMELYNSWSGVLTFMLILFWSAFYLSYGYYVKGKRSEGSGDSGRKKGKGNPVRRSGGSKGTARGALPRQGRDLGSPGSSLRR